MPLSAATKLQLLVVFSLVVAIAIVLGIVLLDKRKSKGRGNVFLLVGPPDSGKTSILSQLSYGQTMPTQTSMQSNTTSVTLSNKLIRVVDVPGHARLRNQFIEYLADTKVLGFVVDASTVSRNAPAVAEHLHYILHALTSLPPSQQSPALLILAHKSDLFKSTSSSHASASTLAINRVKAILERELERRRVSQNGGVNVEGLGEEGKRTDLGGLECGEKEGSTFKFDDWEGGEVTFIGTSIVVNASADEKDASSSLEALWESLEEHM